MPHVVISAFGAAGVRAEAERRERDSDKLNPSRDLPNQEKNQY